MIIMRPGITEAVGGYTDLVKMWGGQKDKLDEYPELRAVLPKWPAAGGLLICNDMRQIAKLLSTSCFMTGPDGAQIWIHVETDRGTETINISNLPERYPIDRNIARMIQMYHPDKGIQRVIVVEEGPKVVLYRNQKRGTSLDDVIASTARKVDMDLTITQRPEDFANGVFIVQLSSNLVWDGEDGEASIPTFQRFFASMHKVVLDLGNAKRIDSAGLGAIVGVYTTLKKRGGGLVLLYPSARFQEQLETTKLSTVIDSYDNKETAVNSFDVVFS